MINYIMQVKYIRIYMLSIILTICCSCVSVRTESLFSDNAVALGSSEESFIKKYGKPFTINKSIENGTQYDKLLYKEEVYKGTWYIVTTGFYFENRLLVKQEVVKEERMFLNDCGKKH